MQDILVLASLLAIGYGFGAGGVGGALTGLVAALGIGSGLLVARADTTAGVAIAGGLRTSQRLGWRCSPLAIRGT